jgi:hypothetical protein
MIAALSMAEKAMALGRDALEILAVEIVPVIRRMLAAASLLKRGQGEQAIASGLGLPPGSKLASRAIDGARRYGLIALERAHRSSCILDESIKRGLVKETREALSQLMMELGGGEASSDSRRASRR